MLDDNSAACSNQLSWLVENDSKYKSGHFSSCSSGFPKVLVRSGVELPGQAENDTVERFRHYNLHVKMNELFSPGPLD